MSPPILSDVVTDPCIPSPCGAFSECRDIGGVPSCSCLPTYRGSPPNCRPECTTSTECPANMACMQQKCRDPCPGLCGILAECSVTNHVPICSCLPDHTGDPFTQCSVISRKISFFENIFYFNFLSSSLLTKLLFLLFTQHYSCIAQAGPMHTHTLRLQCAVQRRNLRLHNRIFRRPLHRLSAGVCVEY